MHRAIRSAVHPVRGAGATDYPVLPCHLTIGYTSADADSDEVQSKLRRTVRPSHAPLEVRSVYLVDVAPDLDSKQIR